MPTAPEGVPKPQFKVCSSLWHKTGHSMASTCPTCGKNYPGMVRRGR